MIDRSNRGQLALAVHQRDFDRAIEILNLLAATSPKWANAVIVARRTVSPPAPLPDAAPMPLPIPGHRHGSTLGKPLLEAASVDC
jgi:hypothetical protein